MQHTLSDANRYDVVVNSVGIKMRVLSNVEHTRVKSFCRTQNYDAISFTPIGQVLVEVEIRKVE